MAAGRGDDSEANPYREAEARARAPRARGPSARPAEPRCRPGQGTSPWPKVALGGDGPCCHSSPARGSERADGARPCRAGQARSSRNHQVRTMHPYLTEELARQRERELRRAAQRYPLLGPVGGAVRPGTAPAGRSPGSASRWPAGHAMRDTRPTAPAWGRRAAGGAWGLHPAGVRRRAWLVTGGLRAVSARGRTGLGLCRPAPARRASTCPAARAALRTGLPRGPGTAGAGSTSDGIPPAGITDWRAARGRHSCGTPGRAGMAAAVAATAAELATIGAGYAAYSLIRLAIRAGHQAAFTHAAELWHAEQRLHLTVEPYLNHLAAAHAPLAETAGYYFGLAHFLVTPLVLAWLYLRRPAAFPRLRSGLVLGTAAANVVFWAWPALGVGAGIGCGGGRRGPRSRRGQRCAGRGRPPGRTARVVAGCGYCGGDGVAGRRCGGAAPAAGRRRRVFAVADCVRLGARLHRAGQRGRLAGAGVPPPRRGRRPRGVGGAGRGGSPP